jgi:hypothetical protein
MQEFNDLTIGFSPVKKNVIIHCLGAPLRQGALGTCPVSPLDKMALTAGIGERRLGHVPPQAFWSGYRPGQIRGREHIVFVVLNPRSSSADAMHWQSCDRQI